MKKLLPSILCYLTAVLPAWTQSVDARFDHFTIRDGLSQSQSFCIFQDSHGYLWIGTQDGLNRFDGNTFKVFKNNPFDSTTLTHNWVWAVQEDEQGDLWVGTFQGLCKYLRKENRFVQYYHNPDDSTSVSGNRPNYILKDRKGRLWISSWGGGLNLYDPATNSFRRFQTRSDDLSTLSDNFVRTLYCDAQGVIWVGTWKGGLNKVIEDNKGIRFLRYSAKKEFGSDGGKRITSIGEDSQGNLWIGSYEDGLLQLDPSRSYFTRVPGFSPNDVNKIIRDRNGNMWIGTNNGLRLYDYAKKEFVHFFHDPSNPYGISSNTVYSLAEDRNGILWVSGNGIDKYDPRKNIFQTYRSKQNDPSSLSQNLVWSFCEDDEGYIWIGTESGALNVFDPQRKIFRHIAVYDDRGNLAENIHKIAFRNGMLWLASYKAGLVRYEKKTGKTKFYLNNHSSVLGKIALFSEVIVDDDGTLWLGASENGLIHFDPETDSVENYLHDPNDPETIGSSFINSLSKDREGNIWTGFWGGGMSVFDKATKRFTNYAYDRKNKNGLSDQTVSSINQQNDSIYWVCTHTGLNRFNRKTGQFKHFFEKDGLSNNVVYEMLEDEQGYFWISSNSGLSKFDPASYHFRNYTAEDGLQSNEFNANAVLKSSTGEFYFGGVNGFNVFKPADLKENALPPTLSIESYAIHGKEFPVTPSLQLRYNENYLSFNFTALEFSEPEKIKYKYTLVGFDDGWIDAGDEKKANYTNLDPGHYTFHVKASNADGYWVDPGASVEVVIRPPFWNTWWFTTLIAVLVSGLIYTLHRYRLMQSLKVERLRNKIASDLHDEVGSSLTRISIYSDLLQNGGMETEGKGYLRNINDLSREVVSTMSDIVWSIDNRSDTLGALIMRMKDFATEILQSKNIELQFKVSGLDESTTLDPAQKQNIYLIFKESINNIVKHAGASEVSVTLSNEGGEFLLKIQDNGKGINRNGPAKGNGLRNMQRRAEAIEGTFFIENTNGTTILVKRKAF